MIIYHKKRWAGLISDFAWYVLYRSSHAVAVQSFDSDATFDFKPPCARMIMKCHLASGPRSSASGFSADASLRCHKTTTTTTTIITILL